MNTFLGVIVFCIAGECSFWKSDLVANKTQCEEQTIQMIDQLSSNPEIKLVQGVCLPINTELKLWQKTQG